MKPPDGVPQPAVQIICPEHGNILTTYVNISGMWVERSPMSQRRQVARAKRAHEDSADPLAAHRAVLRRNRRGCKQCRRTAPDTGRGTDNNWMDWLYQWGATQHRIDTERSTLRVAVDEFDTLYRRYGVLRDATPPSC